MKLSDLLSNAPKGLWGGELKNGESGTPVIKTNNMTYEGQINFTDLTYRSIDNRDAVPNYLQNGDLLVEKSGGTKTHSVGYINYFDGENQKYVANNFIFVLRPNEQLVSPKYLFYQMKYKYESGQIRNCYEQTTGIQNLRVKSYLQKEVLCPSRTIQNDVVLSLDSIASAISIEKASLLLADELIKSRFNEMFDKTVPLSLLAPFNTVRNATPISEHTWLLNLDMVESNTGRVISKMRTSKVDGSTCEFDTACVLYSKLRPYLNKVVVPDEAGFCTSEMIVLRCNPESINRYFLASLLRHQSFVDYINSKTAGSKMPRASMDILRKFPVLLPDIQSQDAFASFVEKVDKGEDTQRRGRDGRMQTRKGGVRIILTRASKEFVKALIENEVPEISSGDVEIVSIARQAGIRTKIAVDTKKADLDPVGATVGKSGSRIQTVMAECEGEKIDIIRYSSDPLAFIANSLIPAQVRRVVTIDPHTKHVVAIVDDSQLGIAIGQGGVNVKLAKALTDWNIEVKTQAQFNEMEETLEIYRNVDDLFKPEAEEAAPEEHALFLSMQYRRITVRAVENLVKKYAKIVSPLKKITPHKLRSTYGTALYRETGDIYIVADVLGHKDVNTTRKHYAAITEDHRKSVANVIHLRNNKKDNT